MQVPVTTMETDVSYTPENGANEGSLQLMTPSTSSGRPVYHRFCRARQYLNPPLLHFPLDLSPPPSPARPSVSTLELFDIIGGLIQSGTSVVLQDIFSYLDPEHLIK